jgi:dihydrofolate synthase/folylpolyglutamate synthase
MLAIALTYFRREKCEYVVLEVGLGGRYDATNIIKDPLVTAITNIDLDHTAVLGPRLEDIASDKAGIIKKSSRFFTTEERPELIEIFKETCTMVGAEFNALPVNESDYQKRNRSLVGSICRAIGIIRDEKELGLSPALPARFEIVEKSPTVIIDGAHNPSKISSTIFNLNKIKYKKLVAVVAISADKDWSKMLELLMPQVRKIYFTRFTSQIRQCVSPKELALKARQLAPKCQVEVRTDPFQAFNEAKKDMMVGDALLVTGSFYLAGDIRKIYCPEERILENRSTKIG